MRIGELAKRVGLSTSAVRDYEKEGLMPLAARTESGYRSYRAEAVGRLEFLLRAKALGLPLQEVRALLNAPDRNVDGERAGLRHVVAHKIADTQRRIADMQSLNRDLESLYVRLLRAPAPGCGHVGDCAIWLPTEEEVRVMADEVACCGELCCPDCSCSQGEPCDCPDCPCSGR